MHNGDHRNILRVELVHDAERKSSEQSTPGPAPCEQIAGTRIGNYLAKREFDLSDEVCAQAHRTALVKFGRRNELALGQRMEDDGHRSAVRAFFNTLFAGMPLT